MIYCVPQTAGWRITKNIDQSTEILNVTLPYIDSKTCRELYTNTNGFDRYITKDKFCAGSIGGNKKKKKQVV